MSPKTGHHTAAAVAGAVLLAGLVLAGCTAGHAVKKASRLAASTRPPASTRPAASTRAAANHLVASTPAPAGKGTVGAFIANLQASPAKPFEVKYLLAGLIRAKGPDMAVYAVRPPDGLLFSETSLLGGGRRIVVNGSGEYRCVQRGTGHGPWTCQQLSEASAATQARKFAVYTAAHWAAYLKKAAFAAGAKATTFTQPADAPPTVRKDARGEGMNCLGFRASRSGISTVCAAAPGILGSVLNCRGASFAMEWYITSPPASLFQLPSGAKVIRLNAGQQ